MEKRTYKPDETGFLTQEDTKSYYSRIGYFYFFLAALSYAISMLIAQIINLCAPEPLLKNEIIVSLLNYAISFVGIYCIATPIAMFAIKPLPKVTPIKEKMKFGHLFSALCISFTFTQVGNSFSSVLISLAERITGRTLVNPVADTLSTGSFILNAIFAGILFPILEELLFRRLLCNRLLPLGEKKAIFISAAIFGFIHGNLFQFAYAFLFGLVLGYVYVKTGKIIYTIIFHCIMNLVHGVFAQLVISNTPLDVLNEIFADESLTNMELFMEKLAPHTKELAIYILYSNILSGLSIAGFVILFVLTIKRTLTFEQGILQTPKEHRISNFFLTSGVAAAIAFIAFDFLNSITENGLIYEISQAIGKLIS